MGLFARIYLVLFNFAMVAGWSNILLLTVQSLGGCKGSNLVSLLPDWFPVQLCASTEKNWEIFDLLTIFQTAAVLEIFHAKFGIVGSRVGTVFQQVFSRVMLVWGIVYMVPETITHKGFPIMVMAWGITEVVRYSWYGLKEMLGSAPYFLTWCRYTFFIVLYPMGVYGEQCLNYQASSYDLKLKTEASGNMAAYISHVSAAYSWTIFVFMLLYIPLFPGLYLHMFGQRKKQLSTPRPLPKLSGIQFPVTAKGDRSTSATGQAAFALSMARSNPAAASAALREKNWRFGYAKHVLKNVEVCCASKDDCLQVCEDGLNFLHNNFEFIRDGETYTVAEAMKNIRTSFPGTMTIKGDGPAPDYNLTVGYRGKPYPKKCELENLKGDALLQQLNQWAQNGSIEPSARDAISEVAKQGKNWLDLSDRYFVLLGAGSAMGPYEILLQFGANIVAVDLDRPGIWERLIGMARRSPGSITFPLKKPAKEIKNDEDLFANAGCNLFTETPEICNWLVSVHPNKEFVIGGYAYLDGELHVRVALAMDAIMAGCCERRKPTTTLAFLCSPTDVFVCEDEARAAMIANAKKESFLKKLLFATLRLALPKACSPNAIKQVTGKYGHTYSIVDGLVVAQGPNYALAKRLQHWRAMLQRSRGFPVSTNIAPSTATVSVVHNKQFAAAYGGFKYFTPMEVAYQETSNSVMAALLIHDVCNNKSKAYPNTNIGNPVNLFRGGSFHGGIWRCAYKIGSIGEAAALLFYLESYAAIIGLAVSASIAAVVGYFTYLKQ